MRIEQRFTVGRPPDEVWRFLQDIPAVASCLPGATLGRHRGGGTWEGTVSVTLGPLNLDFEGEATVMPDPPARRGTVEGRGADRRGGSRGRIEIAYAVTGGGTGAAVEIEADLTLAGPAAQFGRTGLVEEIARRLVGDFASCLESRLASPDAAPASQDAALEGGRLLLRSMWAVLRRFFRNLFGRS